MNIISILIIMCLGSSGVSASSIGFYYDKEGYFSASGLGLSCCCILIMALSAAGLRFSK